jgi:hypothetical protein
VYPHPVIEERALVVVHMWHQKITVHYDWTTRRGPTLNEILLEADTQLRVYFAIACYLRYHEERGAAFFNYSSGGHMKVRCCTSDFC